MQNIIKLLKTQYVDTETLIGYVEIKGASLKLYALSLFLLVSVLYAFTYHFNVNRTEKGKISPSVVVGYWVPTWCFEMILRWHNMKDSKCFLQLLVLLQWQIKIA